MSPFEAGIACSSARHRWRLGNAIASGCARRRTLEARDRVAIPTDAEFDGVWFAYSLDGWIPLGGSGIEGGTA